MLLSGDQCATARYPLQEKCSIPQTRLYTAPGTDSNGCSINCSNSKVPIWDDLSELREHITRASVSQLTRGGVRRSARLGRRDPKLP